MFYGMQFAAKRWDVIAPWQIVTVPFLAGIVFYFYKFCNAPVFYHKRSYNVPVIVEIFICLFMSYLTAMGYASLWKK